MNTLKNLDVSTKSWDPILCVLIRRKLDQQSLAALENSADAPTEIPTLRSVLMFIERRACMLETKGAQPTATLRHQSVHNEESCKICHLGQHNLRACSRFQQMDPKVRRQAIIKVGPCTNCLSTAHKVENCGSPTTCRVCQQRHRSLLHEGPTINPVAGAVTIAGYDNVGGYTLLATAKVSLHGPTGHLQTCRAVIDGGSQVNLISRRMKMSPIEISGIGGKISTAIRSTLKLSSVASGFETLIEIFINPTVITDQPSVPIVTDLNMPGGLPLADPDFRQPGPVDLTLRVEVYSRVITGELLELGPNKPLAQGIRLGYVITGYLNKETSSDTEINPILVEDRDDHAGLIAAYEPTKDKNPMNDNHFDTEDSKRQNEISLDEKRIHLTNVALMEHKISEPEDICSQSRTSNTDSSDRGSSYT